LKNRTAIYISVKKTLKCFLEIPNVLDEIVQYQNDIVSSCNGLAFPMLVKSSGSDNARRTPGVNKETWFKRK